MFPGGPGASIEDFAGHASRFLVRGWNVLTISYSGTSGVGVQTFDRLGRGAVAAMRRDAELVARHVRRRWPGGPLLIVGGSLGATPAIATDILLERRAGGLVLLSPFMKSRPPAEWMVESAQRGGSASYQLQYEAATMGIADEAARERLNRDMAALFRMRRANRPALTVFMSYDRQSLPADAAPYFAANTRQEMLAGWHGIGLGHSGARQAFDEWVSTHEPSWRQ
jgi:alpha-beta hydrolase superfamily lysophospholipase